VAEDLLAALAEMRSDLGEPDQCFDRFDLAEQRTNVAKGMVPPVLQEASRLWRDQPLVRIR